MSQAIEHAAGEPATKYEFVRFVQINCPKCFMDFMVTEGFDKRLRESGANFYCPQGHPQCYRATEIGKLKQQLESAERRRTFYEDMYQETKGELTQKKGQLTKLKNRVANGVCPCCNRSFQNLMNHMKHRHPEFAKDAEYSADIADSAPATRTAMTTADAIRKLGKGEFTVAELFDFLKSQGVNRKSGSVQTSLYLMKADGRLEESSGHGMNKIYRVK